MLTTERPLSPPQIVPAEQAILRIRPHAMFIILRSAGIITLVIAVAAVMFWLTDLFRAPVGIAKGAAMAAAGILALLLIWNTLAWSMRSYSLTTRRLIRDAGVLRRSRLEIPLDRIQHIQMYRSLRERLFGLGTLGFSTAGTASTEMVWLMIDRPEERLAQVRAAIENAPGASAAPAPRQERPSSETPAASPAPAPPHPPAADLPVIGLAGGIGSGKSEVARIFESLGCFVIDSDKQARAALDRPEVRDQLIRWWGRAILKDSGEVDRSEIARIVFADARERRRLESLVHPLVRARRAELIADALARRAVAAVIDAPLLFEAGVDQECDAVVFVDTPRDLRLKRLRQSRGWSEAELERREQAQMRLDEKRRRSSYIIANTGDREVLARQVEQVLADVLRRTG